MPPSNYMQARGIRKDLGVEVRRLQLFRRWNVLTGLT